MRKYSLQKTAVAEVFPIQSGRGQQDGPTGRKPLAGAGTVGPGSTGHEGTLGGPRVDLSPCADCTRHRAPFGWSLPGVAPQAALRPVDQVVAWFEKFVLWFLLFRRVANGGYLNGGIFEGNDW